MKINGKTSIEINFFISQFKWANLVLIFDNSYFKLTHLTSVIKIKGFLNKISEKVAYSLIAVYFLYILFALFRIYDRAESNFKFFSDLWAYPLYKSSSFTVTLGKSILLIGFLLFSFFLAKFIVNKILRKVLKKTKLDIGARSAIENLSSYVLTFIFIIIALSMADIPLAAFTFIGGALAIGFGFGTQNILNNFISGIILQIEKPIKVGDYIDLDPIIKGKVEEIGTRSTKIILANNTHIVVPNSILLEKPVNNWNFKDQTYRSKIVVQYDVKSDQEVVMRLLRGVLDKHKDKIKEYPPPQIYLTEITPQGLFFDIYFWVNREQIDRPRLESDIRIDILKESVKNKVEFFSIQK